MSKCRPDKTPKVKLVVAVDLGFQVATAVGRTAQGKYQYPTLINNNIERTQRFSGLQVKKVVLKQERGLGVR